MSKKYVKLSALTLSLILLNACKKEDPNAPLACFAVPEVIEAGLPTAFNSSCSENAASFDWVFGDGGVSVEANPAYTFSQQGSYNVTLVVTDTEGNTDETTETITVAPPSIVEHSGNITSDEIWIEATHLITSDVYVENATLTIEPGAVIQFSSGRGLYFGYGGSTSGATLIANGTSDKPITFTSAASTKSAGDWDYIGFFVGSSNASSIQHCVVEYGGGANQSTGAVDVNETILSMENSTVRYSASYGISLDNTGSFKSFSGNTLEENDSYPISIHANYTHTIGSGNTLNTTRGILVRGGDMVQEDARWSKQTCPYVITNDVFVGSVTAAKLTLEPGVQVNMGNNQSIYVGYGGDFGTLIAEGTESERIVISSSSPAGSRSPGDWDYIFFSEGAGSSSSFSYCDIEYGGGANQSRGMIHVDGSSVSITHSNISNSQYIGVSLANDASFDTFNNNTFEDNGNYPVDIYSNHLHTMDGDNSFLTGPGILVRGDDIEQASVTWIRQDAPYILTGNHFLGSTAGSSLTIEPGTVLKFTSNAQFYVGYSGVSGNLIADGDPGNMITFTSGAAEGFESPGDWDGIWFYDGTGGGTVLDNCLIAYGGGAGGSSGNLVFRNDIAGVPTITDSQIENSGAYGIFLGNNAAPTLEGNTFTNNALGDSNQ